MLNIRVLLSKRTLFGTFCGFHRHLTTGETAIALRPFYFAVHPDYFGKHPRQRAVNEASLQRLQAYISCIHTHAIAAPTPLTFYVRNTNLTSNTQNEPRFHEVSLTLTSSDIRETVTSILQKCNLSLNYVKSVPIPEENPPENAKAKFPRPVKWEPSFYSTYGIPDPYGVPCKIKVESILSTWLLKNVPSARLKQAAIEPIRVQVKKLEKTVKDEIGLKEIRWDCGWGISHYRACLISLLRIYLTYMPRIQLKGETLVFGNDTGVCLRGDAILSHDDVANNWINFLRNVYKEKNTLDQLPIAELRLSKLLNNIRVVRKGHHPIILASSYLRELQILTDKLEDYQHSMPKARLYGQYSDIRVRVECVYGPLTICPEGDLIIPTGCSPFMLIDFLYHNSNKIKQIRSSQLRSREEEVSLLADVKQLYQLASITRDVNITWQQMKYCCLRLVSDPRNVDMSLAGCHIKVTSFYSVMSDGEICIPWNWKGYFDNKESDDGL